MPSALAVARRYVSLVKGFVLDQMDAPLAPQIQSLGMRTLIANTVMTNEAERERLSREIVAWVASGLRE